MKAKDETYIPQAWADALNYWQEVFPMARLAIAGGCLRDTDAGVEQKDVDIFLWATDLPACEDIYDTLDGDEKFGGHFTKWDKEYFTQRKQDENRSRMTDEVVYVSEYKDGGETFNLIFLKAAYDEEQFFRRLDFGLSRIGVFHPSLEVLRHPDYVEDFAAKVFKIRRCENDGQLERSKQRGERLLKRYEGWTLQAPGLADLPLVEGVA